MRFGRKKIPPAPLQLDGGSGWKSSSGGGNGSGSDSSPGEEGGVAGAARSVGLELGQDGAMLACSQSGLNVRSLSELQDTGRVLGLGRFGTVRYMLHIPSGEAMAVKIIPMAVLEEENRRKVFQEVETLLRSVESPNIVKIYQAFYAHDAIHIVMECMAASLFDVVRSGRTFPEPALAIIAHSLLNGLAYLQKVLHIVHRDIKPANVLISSSGLVKLADFGVSARLESTLGQAETFTGTWLYMDPDRLNGKKHTSNSDVWSLGITLLECALGRVPYDDLARPAVGFFDVRNRIVLGDVPLPPPGVFSAEFDNFIAQCLTKNSLKRPFATQLLDHPFLASSRRSLFDMRSLIPEQ